MSEWKEIIYILMMVSGVGLFALGGTTIPLFGKGFKWLRRYILPAVFAGLLVWLGGLYAWQIALSCALLCAALHLGYGNDDPYWYKFTTALAYAFPAIIIGWTSWIILTPIVFVILFFLSNWSKTANDFVWKICEGLTGFMIAATFIAALSNQWAF